MKNSTRGRVVTTLRTTKSSNKMTNSVKKILYIATVVSISCFYFNNLYYVQQSLKKSSIPDAESTQEFNLPSVGSKEKIPQPQRSKEVRQTSVSKKINLSPSKCALLFFGLPKKLKEITLPSIQNNIIKTNPDCDIYIHTYNVTVLQANERNKEPKVTLNIEDVYLLSDRVSITTNEKFFENVNLTYYHQYFPYVKKTWEFPQSLDNMLKQWYSIQSVWELMEKTVLSQGLHEAYYTRIGLFRIDLKYQNRIYILSDDEAVVPDFGLVNTTVELNDRMFYGSYQNAYKWSHRFEAVPYYVQTPIGRAIGLHSETFLHVLFENVNVKKKPICAQRVRVTGKVQHDCWCNPIKPRLVVCPWWLDYLEKNNRKILDAWRPPKETVKK